MDSAAPVAQAARQDPRLRRLARTAQSFWATDHLPVKQVRSAVNGYARRATAVKQTPVVTVYAVPARDCGTHSAGGFSPQKYKTWVKQVALGLKGHRAMVILEPDAVAMLGECDGQRNRAGLLRYAAKRLNRTGNWVYLDGGHSRWKSPAVMAERLQRSGIAHARGFATNVSNFRFAKDEKAYGNAVVRALKQRGIKKKHFIIDTSRNGAGPPSAGDTCNPRQARVGRKPKTFRKGRLDAYIWVKRPGESDGACNGGPPAGVWWTKGALRLLR